MHHLVELAVDLQAAAGGETEVHHTQRHWDTVWVLVRAPDASTWLSQQVRQQRWPVDLRTLRHCKRHG